mgnify:CR=1 FL=1
MLLSNKTKYYNLTNVFDVQFTILGPVIGREKIRENYIVETHQNITVIILTYCHLEKADNFRKTKQKFVNFFF